jgi:hypothetical protein
MEEKQGRQFKEITERSEEWNTKGEGDHSTVWEQDPARDSFLSHTPKTLQAFPYNIIEYNGFSDWWQNLLDSLAHNAFIHFTFHYYTHTQTHTHLCP